MNSLKMSIILIAALFIGACSNDTPKTLEADKPISVVVNKGEFRHHDLLPTAAKDLLARFKFDPEDGPRNLIGDPSAAKINLYIVAAFVEYPDGWLIASGYGEWGGIVFWLYKNGDYKVIRDDDFAYPIDAVADGNTIFLIQGMSHLGISDGHLLEINRSGGKFKTTLYPIYSYPTAFDTIDDQLVIAVNETHYEDKDGRLTVSVKKTSIIAKDLEVENTDKNLQQE